MRIGIAGFGFVGQAVYSGIKNKDKDNVVIYDKYMQEYKHTEALISTEIIFVCLPTLNNDKEQDITAFEEFFETIKDYKGIVVIKSTILFSNIEKYNENFNIVMNPEFLNQNSSIEDFLTQEILILGGRADHTFKVLDIYRSDFNLDFDNMSVEFCTQQEAIDFKYLRNIHGAYEVLFWNFVQENLLVSLEFY